MTSATILDVGHGNCAILTAEYTVVVDAGRGSALLEFLTEQGIDRVDTVLVSHSDADHLGGLIALLSARVAEVGSVYLNSDALQSSRVWADMTYELDQLQRSSSLDFRTSLVEGDRFDVGDPAVSIAVVAPRPYLAAIGPGGRDHEGRRLSGNSMSAVVTVQHGDEIVLMLPGDLDGVGLDHLAATHPEIEADVLVFPHHGGNAARSSSVRANAEFAERLAHLVRPSTVVFSIGRSSHGNPRPEVVDAVRAVVPDVRIACTQLSEHCAAEVPAVAPTHLLEVFAAGRDRRRCCAGTITIDLGIALEPRPSRDAHEAFVRAATSTPLCMRRANLGL